MTNTGIKNEKNLKAYIFANLSIMIKALLII